MELSQQLGGGAAVGVVPVDEVEQRGNVDAARRGGQAAGLVQGAGLLVVDVAGDDCPEAVRDRVHAVYLRALPRSRRASGAVRRMAGVTPVARDPSAGVARRRATRGGTQAKVRHGRVS